MCCHVVKRSCLRAIETDLGREHFGNPPGLLARFVEGRSDLAVPEFDGHLDSLHSPTRVYPTVPKNRCTHRGKLVKPVRGPCADAFCLPRAEPIITGTGWRAKPFITLGGAASGSTHRLAWVVRPLRLNIDNSEGENYWAAATPIRCGMPRTVKVLMRMDS